VIDRYFIENEVVQPGQAPFLTLSDFMARFFKYVPYRLNNLKIADHETDIIHNHSSSNKRSHVDIVV
jgi:hypothetical protein